MFWGLLACVAGVIFGVGGVLARRQPPLRPAGEGELFDFGGGRGGHAAASPGWQCSALDAPKEAATAGPKAGATLGEYTDQLAGSCGTGAARQLNSWRWQKGRAHHRYAAPPRSRQPTGLAILTVAPQPSAHRQQPVRSSRPRTATAVSPVVYGAL